MGVGSGTPSRIWREKSASWSAASALAFTAERSVSSLAIAFRAAGEFRSLRDFGRLLGWLPLVFATVHVGAGAGILQEMAAEGWSKIKTAFGYSRTRSAETVQVLAWRDSVDTPPLPSQDFPRSLAG